MSCISSKSQYEPPLAEILDEPIIAALMESDRVDRGWLQQLISDLSQELCEGPA